MTLEEAIRTIKVVQAEVEWTYPMEYAAAFDMAISALQAQELSEIQKATDTVSRQAAIDALGEEPEVWTGKDEYAQGLNNQWHYDVNALKALPSAQPEITEDDVKEYCRKRCLIVVTSDFYDEMTRRWASVQPEPCEDASCPYCHEDSDGYVTPLEKNCHAFIRFGMNGWCLNLQANKWHGEVKINHCPMCGRKF